MFARWVAVSFAIGRVTFSELVRDRILYNILLFALLLFGSGLLASKLTFIRPERVVLDFGTSAVAISCGMIGVFRGAVILIREFERRTIAVALSRPISRAQFITGKFMGLLGVLSVNWALMCGMLVAMMFLHGDRAMQSITPVFGSALLFALLQSFLLGAIALFFSTFSTVSLSIIMTIGLYLVGTNVSAIRTLAEKAEVSLAGGLLRGLSYCVPNFESFALGTRVTYGLPIEAGYVLSVLGYGVTCILLCLACASLLIRTRES